MRLHPLLEYLVPNVGVPTHLRCRDAHRQWPARWRPNHCSSKNNLRRLFNVWTQPPRDANVGPSLVAYNEAASHATCKSRMASLLTAVCPPLHVSWLIALLYLSANLLVCWKRAPLVLMPFFSISKNPVIAMSEPSMLALSTVKVAWASWRHRSPRLCPTGFALFVSLSLGLRTPSLSISCLVIIAPVMYQLQRVATFALRLPRLQKSAWAENKLACHACRTRIH